MPSTVQGYQEWIDLFVLPLKVASSFSSHIKHRVLDNNQERNALHFATGVGITMLLLLFFFFENVTRRELGSFLLGALCAHAATLLTIVRRFSEKSERARKEYLKLAMRKNNEGKNRYYSSSESESEIEENY